MSHPMPPDPVALARRRAVAEAIALEAADILARHRGRLTDVAWKGAVDLVTAADRESEAYIVRALAEAFPDDHVVAEEGGGAGLEDADFVWYVDPLDGTTNFVHGLPHFAVSLGAAYRGALAVGVIHAPALHVPTAPHELGVTWSAAVGLGASKNGHGLQVSALADLGRSLVATGFPYDRQAHAHALAARVERALRHCLCIRRLGSAALDLAQVADGTFGVFWEQRLKPWDIAAGVVIVREAGGVVTDLSGGHGFLDSGDVLASNGHLHATFLADVLAG